MSSTPPSPRVEVGVKQAALVTKDEFERDWRQGYAVLVWKDAQDQMIRDPRTGKTITRPIEAVLNFCCIRCQFSTVVQEAMDKHLKEATHFWPYDSFSSPYGHFSDVVIEGIDPHGYNDLVAQRDPAAFDCLKSKGE